MGGGEGTRFLRNERTNGRTDRRMKERMERTDSHYRELLYDDFLSRLYRSRSLVDRAREFRFAFAIGPMRIDNYLRFIKRT